MYTSALLIARFVWSKRIPPYEKVFREKASKDMTDSQMMAMAESLNAMFGGADEREGVNTWPP